MKNTEISEDSNLIKKEINKTKIDENKEKSNLKNVIIKKPKKNKKTFKTLIIENLDICMIYLLLIMSIVLYLFSLKGCNNELYKCLTHGGFIDLIKRGIFTGISALSFSLVLMLTKFAKMNYINYFFYIFIYTIIFFFSQGTDLKNHGTYNCILFVFITVLLIIIFYLFYLLIIFLQYYDNLISKIIVFLILLSLFLFIINKSSCSNWEYGLGNLKIDNDINENICEIEKPKYCTIQIFDGLLDFSKLFRKTCEGYGNSKENFVKYIKNDIKNFSRFYYPLTNNFNLKYNNKDTFTRKFVDIVYKLIGNANEENSKDKEIFVNFDENGKGNLEINLKRNETLVNERKLIAKKEKVKFENIYLIYIDAISRNHFRRKLKKTSELLENILYTNQNKKEEYKKYDAYQFFKYQNFDMSTIHNTLPMIFGNSYSSQKGISLHKFLKEKGYITAGTHNSCNRELLNFSRKLSRKLNFIDYDHENFAMFCDPNFFEKRKPWTLLQGRNSIIRRCLYNKDTFEYCFEYILQFLEAYKHERKFFRISFNDAHEGTQEVVKYMDESLYNFLNLLLTKYYTKKTAILIVSDHGGQIPGLYDIIFSQDRRIEKSLGTFFIIIPNKFKYDKNIVHINEQRLVTPYDIHDTILDFANVNVSEIDVFANLGQSIFKKVNGKKRKCENYRSSFSHIKTYCHCKNYKKKK